MTPQSRLGGFKVLKDLAEFSLILPESSRYSPAKLCSAIAGKKINLPYFTFLHSHGFWGMTFMVDAIHGLRLSLLIEENTGKQFDPSSESIILSIFPHKNDPEIIGRLFKLLGPKGLLPDSLANSPSAISIVLNKVYLGKARNALFEPFSFSAYRTPDDWKLAQKGKERIYKEVIASYQEKNPKVYGLECYDNRELLQVKINKENMTLMGNAFQEYAQLGFDLIFTATGPSQEGETILSFCLPASQDSPNVEVIQKCASDTHAENISPVAAFSMNGPHFGDRYGIASAILTAFEKNEIDLLCLSCTIASISGVVPSPQLDSSIRTIKECFEVPAVIKR